MDQLDKIYYVNIGPHGTFSPSGNPEIDSTPSDVDNIFDHLKKQKTSRIVLYFHGGLVSQNSGMTVASRVQQYVTSQTDAHPISFIWETGLLETISQNLQSINRTQLFKKLLEKVVKFAGNKLGLKATTLTGSRAVSNFSDQEIRIELSTEAPFENYDIDENRLSSPTNRSANEFILQQQLETELKEELDKDEEFRKVLQDQKGSTSRGPLTWIKMLKTIATIIIRVIKRHQQKTDHGFYPTTVEEVLREFYIADLGSWLWTGMKDKASDMWKPNAGLSGDDQHAGSYLLQRLSEYARDHGDLTIDLVGHSAGSIVICHLMKKIAAENLPIKIRNIIFMAPACRCELFSDTILKNPSSYRSFRMFTMSDEWEKKDRLVPVIYTRSLLYLVSGILEDKGDHPDAWILGLERHITGGAPYGGEEILAGIQKYITGADDRVVYSVTKDDAIDGLRSTAKKHGDFDNDGEATMNSIMYLLKQ